MKTITLAEFRAHVDVYLTAAANEEIVLLDEGRPSMLLQPIPDDAQPGEETYTRSPEFWAMIRQRRQEQGIPWNEAKQQLAAD